MASAREVRMRIRSVKNIAQVTRALEAVSASRVRAAQNAVLATRAYARKAFEIMNNLANQPGDTSKLHPLLEQREPKNALLLMISSDRGLAGPYNMNIVRTALDAADQMTVPVKWVTVGRKGRDLAFRRGAKIMATFDNFTSPPAILQVVPMARLAMDEFLQGNADVVYLAYTDFVNTLNLAPVVRQLLPLGFTAEGQAVTGQLEGMSTRGPKLEYIYEPGPTELLDEILPRFTELQVYQAILESLASEHSARMVAMRNATDNAKDLAGSLQLAYNKARQLSITSAMLDIAGGVEAMSQSKKTYQSETKSSAGAVATANHGGKNGQS